MSSRFQALKPYSDATSSDVVAIAQQKRDGTYEALEKDERTHDSANQLLGRDTDDDSTDERSYVYDAVGNLREIDKNPVSGTNKHVYTHDAWNRLVKVEFDNGTTQTSIGEYEYYGTHWRAVRRADSTADQTIALDQERFLFYDASWRLIEERIDDETTFSGDPMDADIDRHMQYIWGTRYIDDIVCRRENDDFTNDSPSITYEDEWYHLTDVQFSTVAIIDDTADLVERISYSAYGVARHHHPGDVDGDGDVDSTDSSIISTIATGGNNSIGDSAYLANADLNRDGQILTASDRPGPTTAALGEGYLSSTDNIVGYDGYLFNIETQHYAVRFRHYAPNLGRWIERDPISYADGMNLFEYAESNSVMYGDLLGLQSQCQDGSCPSDPGSSDSIGNGDAQESRQNEDVEKINCPDDAAKCAGVKYDPSTHCCENGKIVEKVPVFVVNRGGPDQQPSRPGLPRWTGGHIDIVVPRCGMIGFYGGGGDGSSGGTGMGLEGYFLNRSEEWFYGLGEDKPGRPHYGIGPGAVTPDGQQIPGALSRMCQVDVCPSQTEAMCKDFQERKKNPGKFNIIGRNCSTTACKILNAGDIGPNGIPGIDNPMRLMKELEKSGATCFNGYTGFDEFGNVIITRE